MNLGNMTFDQIGAKGQLSAHSTGADQIRNASREQEMADFKAR
jgi:hypothetical protein